MNESQNNEKNQTKKVYNVGLLLYAILEDTNESPVTKQSWGLEGEYGVMRKLLRVMGSLLSIVVMFSQIHTYVNIKTVH